MKVMLVNGSPHPKGMTALTLDEMQKTFEEEGIEVGRFWVGAKPISGCLGCGYCANHEGKCTIDDCVNEFNAQAGDYDGFIFATPVHYAAASGALTSFMDRSFYSQAMGGLKLYEYKPAAGVNVARRGGCSSTYDQLNKYFGILQMPIISASYWNMVYGRSAEDFGVDEEGLYTVRTLAHNMAYFLRCKEAADTLGVEGPKQDEPSRTNFVR